MKFAVRRQDITPWRPCWQGGYAQRTGYFNEVHDNITATAFGIENCEKKMYWTTMDVAGIDKDLADAVIRRANEKGVNITINDVVMASTHTHSGPLLSKDRYGREIDAEYYDFVVETIAQMIKELSEDDGREVTVKYSNTLIDGLYSNRNDKNKFSDKYTHMLGFFDGDKLLAIYHMMAHHCTILGPNFTDLSADLFGKLRDVIEEHYGCPVFMVQSNAGDMGNKQYRTSNLYDAVEAQAANVFDQEQKKGTPWKELNLNDFTVTEHAYHVTYDVNIAPLIEKKAAFEKQLETEKDFDTIKLLVTGIKSFERKIEAGDQHVDMDMPYRIMNMGDLQIVVVPGELGSVLGQRIKDASKAKVCLVWAYVNPQNLGYMIEKEAYEGFSQEANVTNFPAGITDLYIEDIIKNL